MDFATLNARPQNLYIPPFVLVKTGTEICDLNFLWIALDYALGDIGGFGRAVVGP